MGDQEIVLSLTSILYSSLLLSTPYFFPKAIKKIDRFYDASKNLRKHGYVFLAFIPITLIYSLSKELYFKSPSIISTILPVVPIALYLNVLFLNALSGMGK